MKVTDETRKTTGMASSESNYHKLQAAMVKLCI